MAVDTLRVPSHDEPTFFNRTALVGLALGLVLPVGPIFPIVGLIVGGFMGRSRMANEREHGKVVSQPGFFRLETMKDAVIGAGVGSLLGAAAMLVFLTTVNPAALMSGLESIMAGQFASVAPGVLGGLAAIAVAPLVGFAIGATRGKARMTREWTQAQAYVQEHGEYRGVVAEQARELARGTEPEMSYKNSVSPSEERALEARIHANQKDFAALRLDEKSNAADMHATR